MSKLVNRLGFVLPWLLGVCVAAQASQGGQSVYDLVDNTTKRVMGVITAAQDYVDADPDRYYGEVQGILDPLIDYRGFARQVMGPYASSQRYRSLDENGRKVLRGQLDRFTEVMRTSLIRTYGKGLLAFGDARIELDVPEDPATTSSRVSVRQLIYSDRADPYVVYYQMGQDAEAGWMLRNVIIESVNLGEIYRDQFLASAREHDGDLDKVIDSWTTVTVDVDS
jgi:phospholipid transport system substrate-binding protein